MKYDLHFSIAGLIVFLLLYIVLCVIYNNGQNTVRRLRELLICLFLADLLDIVTAYTIAYRADVPLWVNYALNSLFFFLEAVSSGAFARYVRFVYEPKKGRRFVTDYINLVIVFAFGILCATSFLTHAIFYFDDKGYHRGPIFDLTFGIGLYFLVFALVRMLQRHRSFSRRQKASIVAFVLIAIAGCVVQFVIPYKIFVMYFAFSIAAVITVFGLETPDSFKLQIALNDLEKSQTELQKAVERAESADRAKSDFLAHMSHEIRTPINAVLGMNELINRESTQPEIRAYSADIADAGQSLLSLINDILDFSKIEAGRMELAPSEYEVKNLLREVSNIIRVRCEDKGLTFDIQNNPTIPARLYGDDVRIRQILINLLNNALKYTDKGGVTLLVESKEISENQIELVFSVKDTGIGIKEEDLKLLFESFRRIDLEHNRKREGTGLGLNITKSLVEMMGGSIQVSSVYGEGSVFTVSIKQEVRGGEVLGVFKKEGTTTGKKKYESLFTAPEARILVVDDVKMNLSVVKGLLKQTRMQVETALSGEECLRMIQETAYDIIFLDHMMPEMDGLETMQRIKADTGHCNQSTPVIMLTANAILGAKEEYLGIGFEDYLSKPIQWKEMEELLMKYLPKEKQIS